jgi:hypothetical protein
MKVVLVTNSGPLLPKVQNPDEGFLIDISHSITSKYFSIVQPKFSRRTCKDFFQAILEILILEFICKDVLLGYSNFNQQLLV